MQPVFIVGQYKSGTTWLLSALSAHPAAVGLREIDVVRAGTTEDCALPPREERFAAFFSSYPYCRAKKNAVAAALKQPSADAVITLRGEGPARYVPDKPANFSHLSDASARSLVDAVRDAGDPASLLRALLAANAGLSNTATHLVLKAADQIAVFDRLRELQPDAKKLVIMRDGRDAAISAVHFRKLMKKQGAPWYRAEADYWVHLRGWRNRARMALKLLKTGAVHMLRYEDLTRNFAGTFGRVLEHVGLANDPELVSEIDGKTCFAAVTGRERGQAAAEVVRKGSILEWVKVLDHKEQKEAWKLAGKELEAFGYTNGEEIVALRD